MLSTLPKLADKNFILGFALPVFLLIFVGLLLVGDVSPFDDLLNAVAQGENWEKLVYLVLGVWTFSILMQMFNQTQLEILEGYRWPISKVSKRAERCRFQKMDSRIKELRAQQEDAEKNKRFLPPKEVKELTDLWVAVRREFPVDEGKILPTRFGNAIRAFENYSATVYGTDSVALWPHLATVIPKDFQEMLEGARAKVNCLVNLSWFSALICLVATVRLLWNFGRAIDFKHCGFDTAAFLVGANAYFLFAAVGAAVVARLTYSLSIDQIYIWGNSVKAAFDCYLPALATKLGYKLRRETKNQRDFWTAVVQRAALYVPLQVEDWPPADTNENNPDAKSGGMPEAGGGESEKSPVAEDDDEDADQGPDETGTKA
jgi:hypothetical protein